MTGWINRYQWLMLAAVVPVAVSVPASAQVTRGQVRDRLAATEVERCASYYLRSPQRQDPATEIWIMCLHASSELESRDPVDVALRVIVNRGYNVFELEEDPGWFGRDAAAREVSPGLIARIAEGE